MKIRRLVFVRVNCGGTLNSLSSFSLTSEGWYYIFKYHVCKQLLASESISDMLSGRAINQMVVNNPKNILSIPISLATAVFSPH